MMSFNQLAIILRLRDFMCEVKFPLKTSKGDLVSDALMPHPLMESFLNIALSAARAHDTCENLEGKGYVFFVEEVQ